MFIVGENKTEALFQKKTYFHTSSDVYMHLILTDKAKLTHVN